MKHRSETKMTAACAIIAAAVIGAVAYAFHKNVKLEPFGNNTRFRFNGSGPTAPITCLAGGSKIPCTAFSAA
jgi:hypothetical protein